MAATVSQLPAQLDAECVAGDPFSLSVTSSGATITSPTVTLKSATGATITGTVPTVSQVGAVTTVAFSGATTAALNTDTTRPISLMWSLSALVDGAGPFQLVARRLTIQPVGTAGVSSTSSATLAVTVGGAAVSLAVALGGGGGGYDAAVAAFSRSSRTDGAPTVGFGAVPNLTVPTYDGSGQLTHPSLVHVDGGWNGYRYWLAFTPYPSFDSALENPSIVVSNDGLTWVVPPGLTNPIEPQPAGGPTDYNSDTHLVLAKDGYLYLFWRAFISSGVAGTRERIYYRRSSDGVTWSSRVLILQSDEATMRFVSPAVIQEPDGSWRMYGVNIVPSPNVPGVSTAPTVDGPWTTPTPIAGVTVGAGRDPWHLDAHRIGGEYVILINDSTLGDSTTGDLYRAVSTDGVNFTTDAAAFPQLTPCYRPAFVPATIQGANGYEVIYSSLSTLSRGFVVVDNSYRAPFDNSNIAAAAQLVAPYIFADVVNRADSLTVLGTSTTGQAWSTSTGTLGVTSRALYSSAASNARGVVNLGASDVEYGFTIRTALLATDSAWLVFRFQDASNYWRLGRPINSGTQLLLQTVVSGSTTDIAVGSAVRRAGDRMHVNLKGSTIQCYFNGFLALTATSSTFQSATSYGWQCQTTNPQFHQFFARTT